MMVAASACVSRTVSRSLTLVAVNAVADRHRWGRRMLLSAGNPNCRQQVRTDPRLELILPPSAAETFCVSPTSSSRACAAAAHSGWPVADVGRESGSVASDEATILGTVARIVSR